MEESDRDGPEEGVKGGLRLQDPGITKEPRMSSDYLLSNQQSQKIEIHSQNEFPQLDITHETHKEIHQEKEPAQNTQELDSLQNSEDNKTFTQERMELTEDEKFEQKLSVDRPVETFPQENLEDEDDELEQRVSVGISAQPKDETPAETFSQECREFTEDEKSEHKADVDALTQQKNGKPAISSFVAAQYVIQTIQPEDCTMYHKYDTFAEELFNADGNTAVQKEVGIPERIQPAPEHDSVQIVHHNNTTNKKGNVFDEEMFDADGNTANQMLAKTLENVLHVPEQDSIHIIQQGIDAMHTECKVIVDDLLKPISEINLTREREETLEEIVRGSTKYLTQATEEESNGAVQRARTTEKSLPIQAFASGTAMPTYELARPKPLQQSAFAPDTVSRIVGCPGPSQGPAYDPETGELQQSLEIQNLKSKGKAMSFLPGRTRIYRPHIVEFQTLPPVPEEDRPQAPFHILRPIENFEQRDQRNGALLGTRQPTNPTGMLDYVQRVRDHQIPPERRDLYEELQTRCLKLLFSFLAGGILVAVLYWLVNFLESKYDTGGSNVTFSLINLHDNWNIPVVTLQPDREVMDLDVKMFTLVTNLVGNTTTQSNLDVNITSLIDDLKVNITSPKLDLDVNITTPRIDLFVNITTPILHLVGKGTTPMIDYDDNITNPLIDLDYNITIPMIDLDCNITPMTDLDDSITTPRTDFYHSITTPWTSFDNSITTPRTGFDNIITTLGTSFDNSITTLGTSSDNSITTPGTSFDNSITTPGTSFDNIPIPMTDMFGKVYTQMNDKKVNLITSFVDFYSNGATRATDLNVKLPNINVAVSSRSDVGFNSTTSINDGSINAVIELTANDTIPINVSDVIVSTPVADVVVNITSPVAEFKVFLINPVTDLNCNVTTLGSDLDGRMKKYMTKLNNKLSNWILFEKNHDYKNSIFKFK